MVDKSMASEAMQAAEELLLSEQVAEVRGIADALRRTWRALRCDWGANGAPDVELTALLAAEVAKQRLADAQPGGSGASQEATQTRATPARNAKRELTATLHAQPQVRLGIAEYVRLRAELDALLAVPEVAQAVERALDERAAVLRAALRAHAKELAAAARRDTATELLANAARNGRRLTPGELRSIAAADAAADATFSLSDSLPVGATAAFVEQVVTALGTLRIREARRQLRAGLLLTEPMRAVVRAATPALHAGSPILLVGETGGAKTALAEYLASATGEAAEFVSGYGDISAAQLVGSHELRSANGATVTVFEHGPMLRAMREGRPLILDEVNAMPPEFLKRLNRILQLRPGARFAVQEQAGLVIEIAQGFVIIATANEHAPHRYRGIERLSSELVNRFGANTYRVRYPDADCAYTDLPRENALLAAAALADERGELPPGITSELLERVARAAFVSQQVFSGNHGTGFDSYLATEHDFDGEPGLAETVIAPRTLAAILERVALEGTPEALTAALARFVEGVMHREDQRVLALILSGQGLGR